MASPHDEKYEFPEPQTASEAKERMKLLLRGIRNIEKQFGDKDKRDAMGRRLSSRDYYRWRSKASSSLVYKKEEYEYLRGWLTEHRRAVAAGQLRVRNHNNPDELLLAVKTGMKLVLDDRDGVESLGAFVQMIDQYLQHHGGR